MNCLSSWVSARGTLRLVFSLRFEVADISKAPVLKRTSLKVLFSRHAVAMISRRPTRFKTMHCLQIQKFAGPFQLLDADSIFEDNFTSQHDEEFGTVTRYFVLALRAKMPFLLK